MPGGVPYRSEALSNEAGRRVRREGGNEAIRRDVLPGVQRSILYTERVNCAKFCSSVAAPVKDSGGSDKNRWRITAHVNIAKKYRTCVRSEASRCERCMSDLSETCHDAECIDATMLSARILATMPMTSRKSQLHRLLAVTYVHVAFFIP